MKRSGYADLPLHYGRVPAWLAQRMTRLGRAVIEAIVREYGPSEVLRRFSDPFWFQCFGAVLGMDWHSSGITTSVMGAVKRAVTPMSHELGIHICGGRGKHSRKTPHELMDIAARTGIDGDHLVRCSRLSAKVDNTAVQDGFQLYLHSFLLTDDGEWTVVQQGLNNATGLARRYHWHSPGIRSFVDEPHSSIYGQNRGMIINMVDHGAARARDAVVEMTKEPSRIISEVAKLILPRHHEVRAEDVDLKRLGSVLALANNIGVRDFETLLLVQGLGPRTMQSLALVSEVVHGTPARFRDPARFSFAHGGKDGHPAPVVTRVYDETIDFMHGILKGAYMDWSDRNRALKALMRSRLHIEDTMDPMAEFSALLARERSQAPLYGGRTVFDDNSRGRTRRHEKNDDEQLTLF